MTPRISSIDFLRGISILGMIFCAAFDWSAGLPAWMFHCQVPPPDFVFNPDVRGLTWVDLVFPLFIFAMGAAFPFSVGSKIRREENWSSILLGIARRWVTLVVFALVLGNVSAATGALSPWTNTAFRLIVWIGLFACLVRTDRKWIGYCGYGILLFCLLCAQFVFKSPLRLANNDCIILLLSTVALIGSLVYILTYNNLRLRALVWLLFIVLKLVGFDFFQYLIIALPASAIGDLILKHRSDLFKASPKDFAASVVAFAAVVLQLWGLYTREVLADGLLTLTLCLAYVLLTFRRVNIASLTGWIGFALLLVGIVFDPINGGIAKDYCNMSYLLVTGGMAALLLSSMLCVESRCSLPKVVTDLGQNPMIGYTVLWYVIFPLLTSSGVMAWYQGLEGPKLLLGLLQGVILTALMTAATCLCTRAKLFWRS